MATDPEGRYASPRALADDLERWLADEPVTAYRDPWTASTARFCRRHRSTVVPGAVLLVALALGSVLLLHYRTRWELSEREHQLSIKQARRESRMREGFAAIDRAREARTARRPGWTWASLEELARARAAGVGETAALRDEAAAALGSPDLRRRATFDPRLSFLDTRLEVGWPAHHFAFSPDGRRLAAVAYRPSSRVFYAGKILDAETGAALRDIRFHAKLRPTAFIAELEAVEDVAFGPDGRWLAVGTSSGRAHLWDQSSPSPDGMPTATWDAHSATIRRVAFAAGSLFTLADDRELRRWEFPEGPGAAPKRSSQTFRAARSLEKALEVDDGTSLRVVADGEMLRLDPSTLEVRERTPLDASRYDLGWALPGPRGLRCAATKNREVGLLGLGGEPPSALADPRPFRSPGGGEMSLLFDPGGSLLLATFASERARGVRLWDLASGDTVATLPVRGHHSIGAAFSPDGRRLVVAEEKKISSYELRGDDVRSSIAPAGGPILAFSTSPDGSTLACVAASPDLSAASAFEATTWDAAGGERLHRSLFPGKGPGGSSASASVHFDPAGSSIVVAGNDTNVHLREGGADAWRPLDARGKHPRAVFSGDGRRVWAIVGGSDGCDHVVAAEARAGTFVDVWRDSVSQVTSGLAGLSSIAAAGSSVLVGANNGSCYLFTDGDAPGTPETWGSPRDPVTALTLSGRGDWAAVGRQSGALEIRPVGGVGEPRVLGSAHLGAVGAAAFSPDGRTLASGSADRTVRLWRRIGEVWGDPLTLPSESGRVLAVAFAPDGRRLYALSEGEAAIRAWHLDALRDRLIGLGLGWDGFAPPPADGPAASIR